MKLSDGASLKSNSSVIAHNSQSSINGSSNSKAFGTMLQKTQQNMSQCGQHKPTTFPDSKAYKIPDSRQKKSMADIGKSQKHIQNSQNSTGNFSKQLESQKLQQSHKKQSSLEERIPNQHPNRQISSDESEEDQEFHSLPFYEEIKHFEENIPESEFAKIILESLKRIQSSGQVLTYKVFADLVLPKHRKPRFRDLVRLRILEEKMIAKN